MKYKQLTENERYMLSALRKQGLSVPQIATALGRHRTTIWREVKRNSCWSIDGAYRPPIAQRRTRVRRRKSRSGIKLTESDFVLVRVLLGYEWSPEQITGFLKRHGHKCVSHESIYQYVWRDKAAGGDLWQCLRQSLKRRRKRYKAYDSRGRLADKRHISERPNSVEDRQEVGHWEIDTVIGHTTKDCIVTLVERATGYLLIGKLPDRTTSSLNKATIRLIRTSPLPVKTITADNGTEFHQYKEIEKKAMVLFYFATPHHSWERGSNENANGLIRQYLPKRTSMKDVTQQHCDAIERRLNSRPRKRYGFKTPWEMKNDYA